MKYDVTYSCGHTAAANISGSAAERQRKLRYFETHGLCPDCYAAQMQSGTQEAARIREEWAKWCQSVIDDARARLPDYTGELHTKYEHIIATGVAARAYALAQSLDAAWWLQRKDDYKGIFNYFGAIAQPKAARDATPDGSGSQDQH